ncbi:hypothetical protein T4D_7652 [Trichinella pseudospiralis]|uniref:CCHC-type domain-containing protein n=1 Tax=Trichinella pseudospiralis TaxID=6337 RepID=A0A0V1FMG8_TRIPS|nr:hypothetical protein T4D_7652 [Trichinella pseudospiralis]
MVEKVDEESWKKLQFLSAISLLCCVIVVGFCVVLSRCSLVSIDKCSPFWNKTGVRCFLTYLLHVCEGTCVVLRSLSPTFWSSESDRSEASTVAEPGTTSNREPMDNFTWSKPYLGKRRLIKLLDELDQLLEERAALREIEEQLWTSEEHYRQVEETQEEFETTLNDDESKGKAQTLIDELRAVDVVPGSIRPAEADRNVRLRRCALPKFDGDVTKFREFWDQFESSVHQRRDLVDAVKLVYLRDCLTGDALGAIAGLSAANADYQVAVRRLKDRFDRPVVATRRLLLNLVGMPIREWDVKALNDHMDRNVDALTALGKDPRTEALTAADCLITVARELLPEQAKIKWDEQTMEDESAQSDLSRFMQFLRNQAELMQLNHRPSSHVSGGMPSSVARTPKKTTNLGEHGKTAIHLQASVTDRCPVCRGLHQASDCPGIRKVARHQRRALARKAGLKRVTRSVEEAAVVVSDFFTVPAHLREIKPVSAVCLSYLLHVRDRTWGVLRLTDRNWFDLPPKIIYSPLPCWLQISVANILVLRAGAGSTVKLLTFPKLDLGKRRLIKLMDELDQLLEERAALREIEEQLRTSEEHYRQVEESQEEFETTLNDDEVNSAMDGWAKFRQTFRQSKAKAQTLIGELRAVEVVPGSIRSAEADRNVRLPRCALPKFDGDVTKFREFWDQFESSVHQRRDLADAVKLVYLRDCLTGRRSRSDSRFKCGERRLSSSDSAVTIREWDVKALSDHMDRNVDALTALGKDPRTEALTAADCLITVARELLPEQARIKWDEQTMEDELAQSDLPRFMQFLRNQAELMQLNHRPSSHVSGGMPSSVARTPKKTTNLGEHGKTAIHLQASVTDRCPVCRGLHQASDCPGIRKVARHQRRALARKAGLCFHCLKPGHVAKECGRRGDGKLKNGNSGELGTSRSSEMPSDPPLEKDQRRSEVNAVNVNLVSRNKSGTARLQIVRALAHGDGDRRRVVNCLFDTGAERSFFREDVAQELGLRGEKLSVTVHGFGGGNKELQESMLVRFHLSPLSDGPRQPIQALTTKTLCEPRISARGWPHLRDLGMVDEEEEYLTVHVVIGVDYFFRMLESTIVRAGDDVPVAVETCLGWVICGPQTASQLLTPTVRADKSADTEWDQLLRKFWELEAIGISSEEEQSLSGLERGDFERNLSFDGVRYTPGPSEAEARSEKMGGVRRCYPIVIRRRLGGRRSGCWTVGTHLKGSSGEVKCRVVFDGSARFWDISLNDLPDAGPKLQADLLGIVIRFQRYRIGLQADIQKMYLQVALHEADRDVCSDLIPNIYVNDLVVSCDSVADASRITKEATELFGKGDQEQSDRSRLLKTLGIFWQRESDLLTFRPPERVAEYPDTKRGVLKALVSVFDPLGCLAPYTVKAKIIIQLLWQCGVAWDDPLPPETETRWRTWKGELPDISRIVMEGALVQVPLTTITRLELHGFSDASGKAYGTVVYLRLSHRDGRVETRLVAAKSRVAPIKCLSLPRLELMAALLCARLLVYVRRELAMKVERCVHWSDSTITLC